MGHLPLAIKKLPKYSNFAFDLFTYKFDIHHTVVNNMVPASQVCDPEHAWLNCWTDQLLTKTMGQFNWPNRGEYV